MSGPQQKQPTIGAVSERGSTRVLQQSATTLHHPLADKRGMNLAYVTTYNALDIHNWSGTGFMIAKALENQRLNLHYIGSLKGQPTPWMYLKKVAYKLRGRNYDFDREPLLSEQYAQQVQQAIKPGTDIVFSPGTIPIAGLNTRLPKVIYTDATFASLVGFYDAFTKLSRESVAKGHELEQRALDSAALAIYTSDWAACSAINDYHLNPAKVKVVPLGANVECWRDLQAVKDIALRKPLQHCHLLFLAVDWKRKGGEMALLVADKLNSMGLPTTLHIAGIKNLPVKGLPGFVMNHGFISKATPKGRESLEQLFLLSHFLLLPTLADCTPVVLSEANSYGLPCVCTNVGGIPTMIKDGINGKAFPLSAEADSYAHYIISLFNNRQEYVALALSSFNEYQSRLNWDVAGKSLRSLLQEL